MRRFNYQVFFTAIALALISLFSFSNLTHAQNAPAEVGVFSTFQVSPGSAVQVPIEIRGVEGLYGVDFTLKFDPALLQVQDADPAMEGVQAGLGSFLDPGLLLFNNADNQAGTLRFTMSQYNPSEAKSGSGILLVITFEGVSPGDSPLEITEVSLSTREGEEIVSKGVSSNLVVSQGAPTQAATYPVLQQPTSLVVLNTFTPVPTYTPVPTATPKPTSIAVAQVEATKTPVGKVQVSTSQDEGKEIPFLVKYWWILVILFLVVIVIGVLGYIKITRDTKGSK